MARTKRKNLAAITVLEQHDPLKPRDHQVQDQDQALKRLRQDKGSKSLLLKTQLQEQEDIFDLEFSEELEFGEDAEAGEQDQVVNQGFEEEIVEQKLVFLIPPLPSKPRIRKRKGNAAERTVVKADESQKISAIAALICTSDTYLVNSRTRFLRKKLQRSGGLTPWLNSKGLGRFAPLLQQNKIGEAELLNLTMEVLKQIGVASVGPRRKLISAIQQLCII